MKKRNVENTEACSKLFFFKFCFLTLFFSNISRFFSYPLQHSVKNFKFAWKIKIFFSTFRLTSMICMFAQLQGRMPRCVELFFVPVFIFLNIFSISEFCTSKISIFQKFFNFFNIRFDQFFQYIQVGDLPSGSVWSLLRTPPTSEEDLQRKTHAVCENFEQLQRQDCVCIMNWNGGELLDCFL